MKYLFLQSLLIILPGINFHLKAQDTSAITSTIFIPEINEPIQPLQNYLWVQEDKDGKLQIADFLKNKVSDAAFSKVSTFSNPDPFSVWWCKINIEPSFSSDDFLIGVPFDASCSIKNS